MRALRKITFINSANIRYAEVKLDGNVHFIGTQGVGKSTLLRAILFFYNADKQHLGIPKEMRSFDEFYLPHANSYIVYEVEHEHGPFSILVFRSSGRACYRFIDAPYKKEWLIDDHGEVTAEWRVIRDRLGKTYYTKIVDRYEQYRDIIYGNRGAVDKEFAPFSLLEANRYQNIPRSIQNVFLNSRLDANFIKDIIIRSMSEDEADIDLGYFRRQVADFEQEYKDISCWYKLNQKGEPTVRKQAENVVKAYHELTYMERQIVELCGELKYAQKNANKRLPALEDGITRLQEELTKQKRLLAELQQKYDSENASLNQQQGEVNSSLNRLKERKKYYVDNKIDDVLRRYEKEPGLKSELDSLNNRHADLTARFNDITSKYKAIYQNIYSQLESFKQTQNSLILAAGEEKQKTDERLLKEYSTNQQAIDDSFAEKISLATVLVDSIKTEQNDCDKELLKLKYETPLKEEREELHQQLIELDLRERELKGKIATHASEINRIQTEYDKKEAELVADYNRQCESKQKMIDSLAEHIATLDGILEHIKGSLYEWLEENKSDWEQNIGKVIKEAEVLYRSGFNPQLAEGNSLFGVELDLTDLPVSVRRPTQLKEEKSSLEAELNRHKTDLKSIEEQQVKAIDSLKARYIPKIKETTHLKITDEVEYNTIPQKRKQIRVKLSDLEEQAKQIVEQRKTELENRRHEIAENLTKAQKALDKVKADRQKKIAEAAKAFSDAKAENQKSHNQYVAQIQSEIKNKEREIDAEIQKVKQLESDELKGRGAATSLIKEYESKIQEVKDELGYIDANRKLVIDFQRDKEELFDNEEAFKKRKNQISDKIQQLAEKYKQRQQKHLQRISAIDTDITNYKDEHKNLSAELKKAEEFINDEKLCPVDFIDAKEKTTLHLPGKVVEELTGVIVQINRKHEDLKSTVNSFKSNFSANNTFNFPTELTVNKDYEDFACNLDDFLLNNKLEEYRRRTSERYVDILARVSKEMGELTRHESDVDKIIHDINNDFKERNFVGVIKEISLKSVPSSDKMVQLMKSIKDFNDENQYAMGEMNLFTTIDRDDINRKAISHLLDFMKSLTDNPLRQRLALSDLFQLQFRIIENDNDTGWADKLSHVGSEGTDTLVKAMINIMLINVFKEKVSRKFGEFRIHCMMDEIGKLHPQNVKGILDFANARNILLINSSPTTYNVSDYRYTYLLKKDGTKTVIHPLISQL